MIRIAGRGGNRQRTNGGRRPVGAQAEPYHAQLRSKRLRNHLLGGGEVVELIEMFGMSAAELADRLDMPVKY